MFSGKLSSVLTVSRWCPWACMSASRPTSGAAGTSWTASWSLCLWLTSWCPWRAGPRSWACSEFSDCSERCVLSGEETFFLLLLRLSSLLFLRLRLLGHLPLFLNLLQLLIFRLPFLRLFLFPFRLFLLFFVLIFFSVFLFFSFFVFVVLFIFVLFVVFYFLFFSFPFSFVFILCLLHILSLLFLLFLLRLLWPTTIFLRRVISRAPGLKLVVETLITSLKPIGNIVLICCAFFIIFGILGVQVGEKGSNLF